MISTHTHDFHEKNGPTSADFFLKKKKKGKNITDFYNKFQKVAKI
jgi:hypothetical protein